MQFLLHSRLLWNALFLPLSCETFHRNKASIGHYWWLSLLVTLSHTWLTLDPQRWIPESTFSRYWIYFLLFPRYCSSYTWSLDGIRHSTSCATPSFTRQNEGGNDVPGNPEYYLAKTSRHVLLLVMIMDLLDHFHCVLNPPNRHDPVWRISHCRVVQDCLDCQYRVSRWLPFKSTSSLPIGFAGWLIQSHSVGGLMWLWRRNWRNLVSNEIPSQGIRQFQ